MKISSVLMKIITMLFGCLIIWLCYEFALESNMSYIMFYVIAILVCILLILMIGCFIASKSNLHKVVSCGAVQASIDCVCSGDIIKANYQLQLCTLGILIIDMQQNVCVQMQYSMINDVELVDTSIILSTKDNYYFDIVIANSLKQKSIYTMISQTVNKKGV